jgi:hypothetical protein
LELVEAWRYPIDGISRMILWASNSLSVISISLVGVGLRCTMHLIGAICVTITILQHPIFLYPTVRDRLDSTHSDLAKIANNSSFKRDCLDRGLVLTKLNGYKFMTHGGRNLVRSVW